MKKTLFQSSIHFVREKTPITVRQKVGPFVAYCFYIFRTLVSMHKPKPNVLSLQDTLLKIKEKEMSVIRFGDGEIEMIAGGETAFQKKQNNLSDRLQEILLFNNDKMLICIPSIWGDLSKFTPALYKFSLHQLYRNGYVWDALLSFERVYGDAYISRPYLSYRDKKQADGLFKLLFSLWENKDVVLVEGEKSRLGVGNDMFSKVYSLKRILCPPENAYEKYEAIKKESLRIPKESLVLISLGPTGKVLAADLFLAGYRVLDIGHIDMEYEMFLRKKIHLEKVPYKYFNEINERNPEDCNDEVYKKQILATIR